MKTSQMKSVLLKCLEEGGKILKQGIHLPKKIEKKTELSLVTQMDKAAEKKIIQIIRKSFPDHAFLAEESLPFGDSDSRWIIDPLDGTTNYAHGLPLSSVSIAFEHKGEVLLGGVYDPFRNELFFAEKGRGAALNGKKIRVSKTKTINNALLCTGFPYDRWDDPDQYLRIFREFLKTAQEIRRLGSAALDLCYVACGRWDGYWEFKLQPWDKAAGALICSEAGGKLSDFSGKPLTLTGIQNLATNGAIHAEMLRILAPYQKTCL